MLYTTYYREYVDGLPKYVISDDAIIYSEEDKTFACPDEKWPVYVWKPWYKGEFIGPPEPFLGCLADKTKKGWAHLHDAILCLERLIEEDGH